VRRSLTTSHSYSMMATSTSPIGLSLGMYVLFIFTCLQESDDDCDNDDDDDGDNNNNKAWSDLCDVLSRAVKRLSQPGSHDALLLLRSSFSAPKVLYLLRCSPSIAHSHRRRKGSVVGGHHGECGARAYNGGLGAEPLAGSRVRAPGQGVRGRSPPEAESILVIGCPTEPANLAHLVKFS